MLLTGDRDKGVRKYRIIIILCECYHLSLSSSILLCIESVGWVGYVNIIRKLIGSDKCYWLHRIMPLYKCFVSKDLTALLMKVFNCHL